MSVENHVNGKETVSNGFNRTPTPDRSERGYFAKGNRGGPGNPNNRKTHEHRKVLLEAATPEKVREVERALYEKALAGDVNAMKVWLDHMVGRPVQALEVTDGEGEPIGISIQRIKVAILAAVGDDPAAKMRLARALLELEGPTP